MKHKAAWTAAGTLAVVMAVNIALFSFVEGIKEALVWLTVIADIALVLLLVLLLAKPSWLQWVKQDRKTLAFIVAATATSGSLFYSEIAGYFPCKLCWFQRIFMYPLVILLGISLYKKEDIGKYVASLSIPGALVSTYHYLVQLGAASSDCAAVAQNCGAKWVFHLGYITIPFMALTAFLLITLFVLWPKKAADPARKNPKKG